MAESVPAARPTAAPTAAPTQPASPSHPPVTLRDERGRLTRQGMEHVIRSGGSVVLHGRVIAQASELPDANQLAKDNLAADKASLRLRREALARDEASPNADPDRIAAERAAIDEAAERLNLSSAANEKDALDSIARQRAALDAQEAALKRSKK